MTFTEPAGASKRWLWARHLLRVWVVVVVAASGVAVSATASVGSSSSRRIAPAAATSDGRVVVTADRKRSVPGSPVTTETPQFGIAYGDVLPYMKAPALRAALNDAVEVGAGWIRMDFSWADVQPRGPNLYRWAGLDRVVEMARSLKLEVLATVAYTPKWARPRGCTSDKCAPAHVTAFARFARAAAMRYSSRGVRAWEIWNEENTPGFWEPQPDARRYVALLDATSAAIRSVDRDAFIISGGLTATLTLKGAIDTRVFLSQMCALGANRVIDAVGYHPYTYPFLPTFVGSWATAWDKIAQTPLSMVSILSHYGSPHMPIWLTEYGAPTPSNASQGVTGSDEVSYGRQAQIASAAVKAVEASRSIGAMFWYTDRDLAGSQPIDHYGLRQVDGSAKPALAALRQAILGTTKSPLTALSGRSRR